MIKLIENTDYTYSEKYRFYGWEYAEEIKPTADCGVENIAQLYTALGSLTVSEEGNRSKSRKWLKFSTILRVLF